MSIFRSNGKVLLTGEYLVLDGAVSLALPTKYGQSLTIAPIEESELHWLSKDPDGSVWFSTKIELSDFYDGGFKASNDLELSLFNILNEAKQLNPLFLNDAQGFKVVSTLEFKRDWGLGSSSTLINNVAQWAQVDPFTLSNNTFGGSGYDIACAFNDQPILYKLNDHKPLICKVEFNPDFKDKLYFVHLNKKQNSRKGIAEYRSKTFNKTGVIEKLDSLTKSILETKNLDAFIGLLEEHETLISGIIDLAPVKQLHFKDFLGGIKSLGAWGGDFVLVASKENPKPYFKDKGYSTIIPYKDFILI